MVVNGDGVNLRNGPGTDGTTVITTLSNGQSLVRIEKDKYNLNGYIWDRVMLADGTKGYIAQNFLKQSGSSMTTLLTGSNALSGELAVRSEPNGGAVYWLQPGESFTITQKDAANDGKHVWYKVTLPNGIMGYTAAVDLSDNSLNISVSESYIVEPQPEPQPTPEPQPEPPAQIVNENIKGNETERTLIEESNILTEPNTSVEALISQYGDVTVTNADGTQVSSGQIGTGYTVTIGETSYTAIKLGDANGDAKINSADLFNIVKHLKGSSLEGAYARASDCSGDGKINSADLFKIVKKLKNTDSITL
jgi:SH3-like domain-containing protein